MKRFILIGLVALCSMTTFGQKFVLDPLFEDSVDCIVSEKKDSVWDNAEPYSTVKFAKGMEIESCGPAEGYYVAFAYQGQHFRAFKRHLKFSDDNPASMANPLDEKNVREHSFIGHFYASMTPAVLVLLMIGIILLAYGLTRLSNKFSRLTVVLIPLALLFISVIEVVGYYTLGGDVFWWCDNDRYGFFGALWRVIPFGAVVALQYYSIKMYESVLFVDAPEGTDKKISLKAAGISLALCIPVLVVYCFIVQLILGWKGTASEIVMSVLFLGTLLSGIVISTIKNIATMGTLKGLSMSLFCIIYLVGLLVAAWGVVVVLLQLVFQVLMVIAGIFAISMVARPRYYRGSDGHMYSDSGLGGMHRVD